MIAFIWFCCFVPIITYFSPWVGPNLNSIAAVTCLYLLHVKGSPRTQRNDDVNRDADSAALMRASDDGYPQAI
jgi:hypothetical protein